MKKTTIQMYEKLKARYDIQDEEIILNKVDVHWFNYITALEEDLLIRIFYKVTGSVTMFVITENIKEEKT